MPDTYSAKQVANRIGTDAKTLRKFLRSPSSPYQAVGQGKRYEFPKDQLGAIKKAFTAWQSKNHAKGQPAQKKYPVKVKVNEEITMTQDFDHEPTQKELDDIEEELKAHFPDEELEID